MASSDEAVKLPDRLYKYRPFNAFTLRMLTEAELYYAAPNGFNDPMDCDPTLKVDIEPSDMEKLLYRMVTPTIGKEKAAKLINRFRDNSSEYGDYKTDPEATEYLTYQLQREILHALKAQLGSIGVLSLSATWDSPAMWSYYADEHRGLCIEYDTTDNQHPKLEKVQYHAPRAIKVSDLLAWKKNDDQDALRRIKQTYYFAKSSQWKHEREWRDLREKSGAHETEMLISAVHFGMRCDSSVITSIVKLLHENPKIKLWDIRAKNEGFKLQRNLVDRDEIDAVGVREPSYLFWRGLGTHAGEFDDLPDLVEIAGDDDLDL